MKRTILSIYFILLSAVGWTQNIDSLLAEPQTIELSISTPQPRLKETFQISIDINHLRANIFKSLFGAIELANDIGTTNEGEFTMSVKALKKGINEIGPLEFYLDKTKYTTNKIVYEVIEALPNIDKGIWFRKVNTSDTRFCIIIEQRIPAKNITTENLDSSLLFTTEPINKEIASFKDNYSINGLSVSNSFSNSNYSNVTINGENKPYMYGYSVYHFYITDSKAKIKITKDHLKNLPEDYTFDDIIIQ